MYAIIHKNQVLVGPKDWGQAFFAHALNRVGIVNALIPRKAAENLPLVIDENTKIVNVSITEDEFTPMIQSLRGPLWTLGDDEAIAHYEVENIPLERAQNNFKELAATERYRKENVTIKVTVQDVELSISTSRDVRDQYAKKAASLGENGTAAWKFNQGWFTLNKTEFLQIAAAIESHVQSTFDWEKSVSDLIDAAQTTQELLAIEIMVPTVEQI
jgi:hypothetical protein